MTPPTIDNLSVIPPEPPAPGATPARAMHDGDDSFQNLLQRAGSRGESADRAKRDEAGQGKPAEARRDSPQRADEAPRDNDAQSPSGAANPAKNDAQPAAEGKAEGRKEADATQSPGNADGQSGDAADEHEHTEEEAAAALAALAAATLAQLATTDEVTLSDEGSAPEAVEVVPAAKSAPGPQTVPAVAAVETTAVEQIIGAENSETEIIAESGDQPQAPATDVAPIKTAHEASAAPIEPAAKTKAEAHAEATTKPAAEQPTSAAAATVVSSEDEAQHSPSDADRDAENQKSSGAVGEPPTVPSPGGAAVPKVVEVGAMTAATNIAKDAKAKSAGDDKQPGSVTGTTGRHAARAPLDAPPTPANLHDIGRVDARGETPAGGDLSQADRARLVQRVAKAVQTAQERGGDLQIRLSPPELGSLRLHVKLADGALSARLEAETPQARQVLTDALPQLRERLAQQDIRIERFDVELFHSGGGGPNNLPDRRQDAPRESGSRGGDDRRTTRQSAITGGAATAPHTADGRLDIVA